MRYLNLKKPEHSYFFGFAQADGSLTKGSRNRGKFQIEIGESDLHLLKFFKPLFSPVYSSITLRERDTNFKKNHRSFVLNIFNMDFREEINGIGIPYGKKTEIIVPPKTDFCERDYIRGLVDGDGSIGVTVKGFPFISLAIKSEDLKEYLFNIIEKITGERKRLNRNKRDGIYNIMINREKAQEFIKYLYYPNCLALRRKLKSAERALKWKRPKEMRKVSNKKFWEKREDKYILTHSVKESCDYLERTKLSVGMRLWRFKNNKIKI